MISRIAKGLYLVWVAMASLPAQTSTGDILGTVTDVGGGLVAGARVVVTNAATNITWAVTSNESGEFVIPFLPPGPYTVVVEKEGFKKQMRRGLTLAVDQKLRVDSQLAPGEVTQTMEVEAAAPLLETETTTLGKVITGNQIVSLPLNGRSYLQLALLVPGVARSGLTFPGLNSDPFMIAFSAAGQRPEQNNFMLDGIDNKEPLYNQPAVNLSVDAIGEFKVITGIAPAEYGRGGGAIISSVTRSGSNAFHGNLFEFLRNNAMDARSYFAAGTSHLVRNQFGGSLGGPILIPKIYNGKNRTFFFVNTEALRQRAAGQPPQYIVPTAALRSGAFPGTITDPTTRQPFPGNAIPQSRLNPISLKLQEFFPPPNNAGVQNFIYNAVPSTSTDTNTSVVRIDQQLTGRDNLYGRYTYSHARILVPPTLPTGVSSKYDDNQAQGASVAEIHTFGPRVVNEFRVGWQRRSFAENSQLANKRDILSELGVTGIVNDPLYWQFPGLTIAGFSSLGDTSVSVQSDDVYQFLDSLTLNIGKHTFRMGGDVRWYPHSVQGGPFGTVSWSFGAPAFTGNAYADFLLGLPQQTTAFLPVQNYSPHFRTESVKYFAGFIQDDWKVTPNLTLNLGLRYEIETPIRVEENAFTGIDTRTGTLLIPKSLESTIGPFYQNVRQGTPVRFVDVNTPYDTDKNNFAPRVGFAYRPRGLKNTVIRAGAGVFYAAPPWQSFSIDQFPPYNVRPAYSSNPTTPTLSMQPAGAGFGSIATAPIAIFPFASRDIPLGYNQQWSFEIQQGLSSNWLAALTYRGSSGHHNPRLNQGNLATPGPGSVQDRLPFPWFSRIQYLQPTGNSSYEGLSLQLEKRFSGSSQLLLSYTFSKTIDDAASTNLVVLVSDPKGRQFLEKGLSDLDVRHNFIGNFTYMLPVGRGHRLLGNAGRVVDALFGQWQFAGIASLRSSPPVTPSMAITRVNFAPAGVQAHPDRIANGNLSRDQRTADRWFDPAAFVLPPPFTPGTAGRNIVVNPGIVNFDLSLAKTLRITERFSLQVRGEAFNAFNHANFGPVSANIETPATFGKVLTRSDPRVLQVGMRLEF